MPLYEYECEKCAHRFEQIRRFSDPPLETCPVCGGPVRKLMSSPAIQFKGSGWYITDYARKDSSAAGKGEKAEAGSGASGDGAAKSDARTESKSEAAADSKTSSKAESATPAK
jgi:putative FmdB family regulatory protein